MLKKSLLTTLCLTLSVEVVSNIGLPATATPSPTTSLHSSNRSELLIAKRRRRLPRYIPGIRASRNREGGAARGKCSPQNITAVVPAKPRTMAGDQVPVELTVASRPTFFVNLPSTDAQQVGILVMNEKGSEILFDKTIPLTATNGIVSYTLPSDARPLEVGKKYRWRFSLICDSVGGNRSGNPKTGGWIERVEPSASIANQLKSAPMSDRVAIYAQNGYWYDMLKALADLRTANPSDRDLTSDWAEVLKSVGLNDIANQPLVQLNNASSQP